MTVISEPLTDPAGRPETEPLAFYIEEIRQNRAGTALVSIKRVDVTPVAGVLTTPDLDPGSWEVQWRGNRYKFELEASATPVKLWDLIEYSVPVPAPVLSEVAALRNEVIAAVETASELSTAQDAAVAELVTPGTATKAVLDGTYAPVDVAEGLVSEDAYRFVGLPTVFHDFVGMAPGSTPPAVTDSGHSIYFDSDATPPFFTGNDFTSLTPGGAVYMCTEDLGEKVTHVGARFKIAPNGGGDGGLACVAITDRRWQLSNIANTNMGVHLWCTPTSWALTVWVAGTGQVPIDYSPTYKGGMRLLADGMTEYMMQCWVTGDKATIILPDGDRRVLTDPRFTSLSGNFAFFESMPNAADDDLVCISTVRAGTGKTRAPWPV